MKKSIQEFKDLYEILGVSKEATSEEIKEAFRRLAKECHPDKEGGSSDKFVEVCRAYEILSNPKRREEYDKYGEAVVQGSTKEQEALKMLVNLFMQVANSLVDIEHTDLFAEVREKIRGGQRGLEGSLESAKKRIEKCEKIKKRIKRKKKKKKCKYPDVFSLELDKEIRHLQMQRKGIKLDLDLGVVMKKILDEFEYKCEDNKDSFIGHLLNTTSTSSIFGFRIEEV